MSKVSNKQIASALRKALPFLWNGNNGCSGSIFICHSVNEGDNHQWCRLKPETIAAKKMIESRLMIGNRTWTFDDWLRLKGVKNEDMTSPRIQAHRKAWLLKLIKEFSK